MPSTGIGYKVYASDVEKLKTYKHRLTLADKKFDEVKDGIVDSFQRYRMKAGKQRDVMGHSHQTPVAVGTIDTMFSALTSVDIDVVLEPVGAGDREQTRLAETALRQEFYETKAQRKAKKAVKDALIAKNGWLKVDYEFAEVEETRPRSEQDIATDVNTLFDEADRQGLPPPLPDDVSAVVPAEETVREAVRDRIIVDPVPWDMLRWDPSAKQWDDVRWVAQYTRLTLSDVQGNPVFEEYCKERRTTRQLKDLKGDAVAVSQRDRDHGVTPAEDDDRVTIVELWDLESGTVCTFPKNADFLLNERPNPFFFNDDLEDKNPYCRLVTRDDPESVWGISEMDVIKSDLDELDEYRSNLSSYIARHVPKIAGPSDALTEGGKRALQSREYGAYIELEQGHVGSELQPINPPPLPQEAFDVPNQIKDEIREATGASELMRGLFPDRRRTATETNAVQDAGVTRQSEKRDLLATFYEDVFRRMLMLMQAMYDKERISRLVDDDADIEWEWSAEDITMEMQMRVHLSPREAVTRQTRRDTALAILNLLTPLAGANIIDIPQLAKWALQEMGLRNAEIREFLLLPEEQQQKTLEQLQVQQQEQAVASGEPPDPAGVPGPMTAEQVATGANPGTLPPELAVALAESLVRPTEVPA